MIKNKLIFLALMTFIFNLATSEIIADKKEKTFLISERILLNTDRRVYIAGENLMYSLYLIDSKANSLAAYSSLGYVLIKNTKGAIIGTSQVKIIDGKATGAIYLSDTLQSGYYQILAYTNFMRNGPPELISKSQVLIANRFDKDFFGIVSQRSLYSSEPVDSSFENRSNRINILLSQKSFNKREKCSFKLSIPDNHIKYTDVSVSVVEKNLIEEQFLRKEGKPVWVRKAITGILSDDYPVYLAEDRYSVISGRLMDVNNNEIGYHVLYLTSPDTVTNLEYTVTNAKGQFRFPISDYYNGKDIFIKIKQNEGESIIPKIIIDSKFDFKEPFDPALWPIDSSIITYLKRSQDIVRIQKSYLQIQSQFQPKYFSKPPQLLFKIPDYSVAPADYLELKDFQEISREIIPALKLRKHDKEYSAEILDLKNSRYLPPNPMIFLDGVLLDDIKQVMPFGTKEIKKINLITSGWMVDHQELAGVLSIFSHNNLWKTISMNSDNVRLKAESYFELPKISNPNYSIIDLQSPEPDFRQLLYYKPHLQINSNNSSIVEFYTSDYSTTYIIKVVGITNKGERVEVYDEFEVKD